MITGLGTRDGRRSLPELTHLNNQGNQLNSGAALCSALTDVCTCRFERAEERYCQEVLLGPRKGAARVGTVVKE